MEFENLKNVLGEAYHEGITAEEVNNFCLLYTSPSPRD